MLFRSGLIQLAQDANGTAAHIVANPRQLKLVELDAAQLPRSLDDVDAAVINANFALDAGLNPRTSSLLSETRDATQQGCFARTTEAKHTVNLAFRDVQAYPIERWQSARRKTLGNCANIDRWWFRRHGSIILLDKPRLRNGL